MRVAATRSLTEVAPDHPGAAREASMVEDKETQIKDVLKSGLGDLFHQKREVYHGEEVLVDLPLELPPSAPRRGASRHRG
eukprot:Skav202992  [mRNA]  locus=scaffold2267:616503:621282:- [translate_table: standard]